MLCQNALSNKGNLEDYIWRLFLFVYSVILGNGCVSGLKSKWYICKGIKKKFGLDYPYEAAKA